MLVALTAIGVVCVVAEAVIVYGEFRWNSGTTELRGRLEAARIPTEPKRFWGHAIRDGMHVPLEGEVAWLLPEGAKPYWRGQITTVTYEFSK